MALETRRIEILRTCAEIEAVRNFWDSCGPHRDADLDYYLFFVNANPETLRPHVVVLYEGDAPKGILVGRVDSGRIPVKAGYISFPVPKMRILQIVHGGWLGEISDRDARLLIASIMESLRAGEADAAFLHYPNMNSPLLGYARTLPSWLCADHLIGTQIHLARDLTRQKGGGFLASLSKKERYHQRNRIRMLAADFGDSRIELYRTEDDVDRLVRDAETVAGKSYQRGLGVGFADTPITRARLAFEARKGWLQAYVLYLNNQPCALWIGSLRNGVFLSNFLAFDPAYAKFAPGMYLIVNVIEQLSGVEGSPQAKLVDFGGGHASYKERFADHHWYESPLYVFAPTAKAVGVNILRTVIGLMSRRIREFLSTGMRSRIKRVWRSRLHRGE